MKTILIFSLICFTFCVWGPVDKIKNSNSEETCGSTLPDSPSDCVDLNLKVTYNGKTRYADRCCYVRYQEDGIMNKECYPIPEEAYLDITEAIKEYEKDVLDDDSTDGKDIKVYQFDCAASNIKFLSIASILLALLF